ncbi:MAG TPA: MFS transporter, partial [Thermodesulfobacteriota bacterium]|nr:MFS transporter [Thermodesulfobacteriota bacterium]
GWATDFLGERQTLILGFAVQGVFILGFAWIHSFLMGGLLLLLSGIGYSSVNPATTKGIVRWFAAQGRATAMGIKQTGIPLGGILAAFTLPGLATAFGWRVAVLIVGAVTCGFIAVVRLKIPPHPHSEASSSKIQWKNLREVLFNRSMVALSVMGIFVAGAQLSIITHMVLFLKNQFLFSSIFAGMCLAATQAGGTAGRIGWGLVSDFLLGGKRKPVLIFIGCIAVLQLLLFSRMEPNISTPLLLILVALMGSTTIGYHGVLFGLMGELVRKEVVGLATGFSLTITFLGIVLFPPLFGHVVDRIGSYQRAWDMLALAWVAALVILIFFVSEKPSPRGSA